MAKQSRNPGSRFWLQTLIGVPFATFAIVWVLGVVADSGAALLCALGLWLAGTAVAVWRLPRVRDMEPVVRLTWTVAGVGLGAGATAAWAAIAAIVILRLACGSGGCDFTGMD